MPRYEVEVRGVAGQFTVSGKELTHEIVVGALRTYFAHGIRDAKQGEADPMQEGQIIIDIRYPKD